MHAIIFTFVSTNIYNQFNKFSLPLSFDPRDCHEMLSDDVPAPIVSANDLYYDFRIWIFNHS